MDAIKRSPEALVTYGAIAGLGFVSDKIARSVRGYYADKVSVVLTNVPGPSRKLYFAGKVLDTIVFWVPQSGSIGVGISIFSYGGQVNIGLITDRGLAPDQTPSSRRFRRSLTIYCVWRACGKRRPVLRIELC